MLLVDRDDEATGIGLLFADLTQLLVGLHEHGRQPLAVGVEGGSQSGAAVLGGDVVGERRFLHGTVGADPLHVAIETREEDRPHDTTVDECGAVVVLVVADGVAVIAERVANERDRGVVGTERSAGQQEPRVGLGECLGDALAPGEVTAGVVDFVEDDDAASTQREQCASRRGALGVGDDDAVHVGRDVIGGRVPVGFEVESEPFGGLCPLGFEVTGRRDDNQRQTLALQPVTCGRERERRLSCAGASDGRKLASRWCRNAWSASCCHWRRVMLRRSGAAGLTTGSGNLGGRARRRG